MGSFDGVQVMSAVSWRDIGAFMPQQRQGRLAATTINRRRKTLAGVYGGLMFKSP
jgi:hypothetical protein